MIRDITIAIADRKIALLIVVRVLNEAIDLFLFYSYLLIKGGP